MMCSIPLNHIIKKPLSLSTTCPSNLSSSRLRLGGRQKCGVSGIDNEKNEAKLPAGLEAELMPKHVAVIMDGNRSWAKNRGLSAQHGHRAGGEAMKQLFTNCLNYGVKVVTVFAFSTQNWIRPQVEVEFLMNLFEEVISSELKEQTQDDVRISFVGNREQLPESLQKLMWDVEERTKENKKMQLVMAMNYSGRYDITEATKRIARKVRDGVLEVEEIDEGVMEKHLETNGVEFPNPDLLIRSSGELRVSNFMLWQLAYTEMFFTNKMFPEFDDTDLIQAFTAFQKRQRRFGGHKY
ncbi:Undecaprenyl pyrophosphate synthetase family protein [Perilla frutescens var. hirtella]|nr:Undecaprenyl pyrophosphate synthetase family protein [Perilla frutescens var. hirtella]